MAGGAPARDLARVDEAERRLEALVAAGTLDPRRPSALPGWSVGHVLTHLARNADSHRRRAEAAAAGETVEQYPGGRAGRATEIERGASRALGELAGDLAASATALAATWRSLPEAAWDHPTVDVAGRVRALRLLPARRWQELWVHACDLDAGFDADGWPADFVDDRLPVLRATVADRLPPGAAPPPAGAVAPRLELAWLYGRARPAGFPALSPFEDAPGS